jgi:hypothetical protein
MNVNKIGKILCLEHKKSLWSHGVDLQTVRGILTQKKYANFNKCPLSVRSD